MKEQPAPKAQQLWENSTGLETDTAAHCGPLRNPDPTKEPQALRPKNSYTSSMGPLFHPGLTLLEPD